jgi:hypothetical protein
LFTWNYVVQGTGAIRVDVTAAGFISTTSFPVTGSAVANISSLRELRVHPVPFNPSTAVRGTLKFDSVPAGSRVRIYSAIGQFIWESPQGAFGTIEWNGRNGSDRRVSPGVYHWIVGQGGNRQQGRLVVE